MTAAPPAVFVPDDLATLPRAADLVELRLDLLPKDVEPAAWIAASPRPVLATVRSKAQGGLWRHGPETAAELLTAYARAGAAWLDVEQQVAAQLGPLPAGVSLLASAHGGAGVDVAWAVRDARFARVKLARPCDDARAFTALLDEARAAPAHQFCVPYGKLAETRTLFAHGRAFLYGAARADAPAALGQPTLDLLLDELRAGEVTLDAALYGLVGDPPSRSPSPALHNTWFRWAERDALYVPLPGLPLDEAIGLPFQGFSVTMPWKESAFHMADHCGDATRAVGVANTLVRIDSGWDASNTDLSAVGLALVGAAMHTAGGPSSVFIYGAGGYARAAIHAAKTGGWDVRVAARKERAALELAQAFGVAFAGSDRYERREGDAAVINTTPAGADGAPVPAFADADLAGLLVLDAPYAPAGAETGLVAQARRQQAAAIQDGRSLLTLQAFAQWQSFQTLARARLPGGTPPRAMAPRRASLVLVGPRGAGKTTVGRELARACGRPFVDTDEAVLRITGRTPAQWIEQDGWAAFRAAEHDALERALARDAIVIATGGGCVEHEASRGLLDAAACVVFLDVPPAVAAARLAADPTPRPRLPGTVDPTDEAAAADRARRPHWTAVATHTVDASVDATRTVDALALWWPEQDTMKP